MYLPYSTFMGRIIVIMGAVVIMAELKFVVIRAIEAIKVMKEVATIATIKVEISFIVYFIAIMKGSLFLIELFHLILMLLINLIIQATVVEPNLPSSFMVKVIIVAIQIVNNLSLIN